MDGDKDDEFEIINTSDPEPINYRKLKRTWSEYFRKIYMTYIILSISISLYFYYLYKPYESMPKGE